MAEDMRRQTRLNKIRLVIIRFVIPNRAESAVRNLLFVAHFSLDV